MKYSNVVDNHVIVFSVKLISLAFCVISTPYFQNSTLPNCFLIQLLSHLNSFQLPIQLSPHFYEDHYVFIRYYYLANIKYAVVLCNSNQRD